MAFRRRQLLDLDDLRRRVPHVTQSALSGLILELKRVGLPALSSRRDMRLARDMKVEARTPYGPISVGLPMRAEADGSPPLQLLIAHPLALLWRAFYKCDPFASFVQERLAAEPCTADTPWCLLLYCDEVHPGDPNGGRKARKFQAVYYSFLEFGPPALSHDDLWFTLTTTRSGQVNKIAGGLAQIFAVVLKDVFGRHAVAEVGVVLNRPDGYTVRLFIKLGFFIMDGSAHTYVWHCKGDAGSKLCILCRNLSSHASEVADEDGTFELRCNVTKKSELDLATSQDLRHAVRRLEALKLTDNPDTFKLREMALGFVWKPYSLLSEVALDDVLAVTEQFLHDWMHMIFVSGIWNLVLWLVLNAVNANVRGNIYAHLKDYIQHWRWPHAVGGHKLDELFSDDRRASNNKAQRFRCSASEGL